MTDPVEALTGALVEQAAHFVEQPESFDTRESVAQDILAALRASGFDVVPTGEPADDVDPEYHRGWVAGKRFGEVMAKVVPTREPAGSADAAWLDLWHDVANGEWSEVGRVDEHQRAVEAAIRAESTGTLDVPPGDAAWTHTGPLRAAWDDAMQEIEPWASGPVAAKHWATFIQAYRARLSSSDTGWYSRVRHAGDDEMDRLMGRPMAPEDTGGRVEPMTEQEMDDAIKDRRLPW